MKTGEKDKKVSVCGWVAWTRNLGKVLFLIIQQSEGKTIQAVVKNSEDINKIKKEISNGDFVKINGFYNKKIQKKDYLEEEKEIFVSEWEIINKSSKKLPFEMKNEIEVKESNRYKYRYIDLRRKKSISPIIAKAKFFQHIRSFLNSKKFIEVDTPILSQFSPEGAKTFFVPSNEKDKFYTLPQSPQIFKQILMMSGFSKYYQIAKNFRNEDARSNRQPEFLQLDIETWFPEEKKIFSLIKLMIEKFLTKDLKIKKENIKFKKISFEKCMKKFGSDKPDLRNCLEIESFESCKSKNLNFFIFLEENFDKKVFDNFQKIQEIVEKKEKIEIFIFKKTQEILKIIKKFQKKDSFDQEVEKKIEKFLKNKKNGFYIVAKSAKKNENLLTLGSIRSLFNECFENNENYEFLWINNWPLFENQKNEKGNFISFRHPFTMPKEKHLDLIFNKKIKKGKRIKCEAYDLICNGEELASGSKRINNWEVQKKIFEIIGFSEKEINDYFGYFLEALSFAAPPHGGIGLGIERAISVFLKLKSLKDSIAFPKNIDGSCSLTGSPNIIKDKQI